MKIKFPKVLLFFLMLFIVFSCSQDDSVTDSVDSIYEGQSDKLSDSNFVNAKLRINKDVFDELNKNRINNVVKGDGYSINSVKREGDLIQINVTYSGGCRVHEFEIVWDGIVYTDSPCHMNLLLVHNGNGDTCEALITDTVIINVNTLVGDVDLKDSCSYHIFSTFNSNEKADAIVQGKK